MSRCSRWAVALLAGCGPVVSSPTGDGASSGSDDATSSTSTVGSTTVGSSTVGSSTVGSSTVGSSTSTSTSSEVTSDPSAESISFIDSGFDDGGVVFECDQWAQDCAEGEKCMPWANDGGSVWNATRCSPLDPNPRGTGEECMVEGSGVSGIDNCDIGAMCFDVDPRTNTGECFAFCQGDQANPLCDDECSSCAWNGDDVLILCVPICDPLAQSCDEGEGCYPSYPGEFACAPDVSQDEGAAGMPCEFLDACDPGTFCADAARVPGCEGTGCCAPFCDLGGSADCSALPGTSCVAWFEAPGPFGGCVMGTVGACLVPE